MRITFYVDSFDDIFALIDAARCAAIRNRPIPYSGDTIEVLDRDGSSRVAWVWGSPNHWRADGRRMQLKEDG